MELRFCRIVADAPPYLVRRRRRIAHISGSRAHSAHSSPSLSSEQQWGPAFRTHSSRGQLSIRHRVLGCPCPRFSNRQLTGSNHLLNHRQRQPLNRLLAGISNASNNLLRPLTQLVYYTDATQTPMLVLGVGHPMAHGLIAGVISVSCRSSGAIWSGRILLDALYLAPALHLCCAGLLCLGVLSHI